MTYGGKLFVRVGDKGAIAFVRFNDTADYPDMRYGFTIVWSCGGDRLPTGETGNVHVTDIDEMVDDGTLIEVNESTSPCPAASA